MSRTRKATADNLGGWVLRCNPDVFDLPQAVRDGDDKVWDWLVSKSYRADLMAPEQRVVLWLGGPRTVARTPGIWGIGHVTGPVHPRVDVDQVPEYWLDEERSTRLEWVVDVDVDILQKPVASAELKAVPELAGMEVFRASQMSNPIYLSPEEMHAIEGMVGPWPDFPGDAPTEVTIDAGGAAFGDPEVNQVVEMAAMASVEDHFHEIGWTTEDVSAERCGWDITCIPPDGNNELHVEVKGISGSELSFLLTHNEHDTARADPLWRLAAVTDALGTRSEVHLLTGAQVVDGCRPFVHQYRSRPR
jgi:hypothetical protein